MTEPSLEQIEEALSALGREHRSPAGWEERVLAATRRRRRIARAAIVAAVAAAAALLLWWGTGRRPSDPRLAFEWRLVSRGEVVRGTSSARLGDSLHAAVRGGRHRAIWVYRGARLAVRCPGSAGCTRGDGEVILDMPLEQMGRHTVVGLSHDEPLPEPGRGYDADVAAARRAGARVDQTSFDVQ